MEKFDAVIVGAGPAGSTAAYLLAQAGLQVVVIERGQTPGMKNVSGGLVFSRILQEVFPEFWEEAPVERAVRGHSLMFLGEQSSTALEFRDEEAVQPPFNAFSVLRARFDPWLAQKAEEAGAMVIPGYTVEELLLDEGRVVGVRAGSDELMAEVVVVAEGTRAQLIQQAGLRAGFSAGDVSLGVKEVIQLSEETINERFQCRPGEGVAYTTVGRTGGIAGGGFVYTNRDTVSLGVVVKIGALAKSGMQPHEVLDRFKEHPSIARMISGGEVVEYSAQTVHKGGLDTVLPLYGDGYVVAGSAARLVLNNVMTLRGMDLAVSSGAAAAQAVIGARDRADFSAQSLSEYEHLFQQTSVYKDLRTFKDVGAVMDIERMFEAYPELISDVMKDLFSVTGQPGLKAYPSLRSHMQGRVSMLDLARDGWKMAKGLVL